MVKLVLFKNEAFGIVSNGGLKIIQFHVRIKANPQLGGT